MDRAAAFDTHSDRDARTRPDDRKPRERKDFEVMLVAPFGYTNTPVRASTDNRVGTKGDWYASPDISLKWSRRYSWVISLRIGLRAGYRSAEFIDQQHKSVALTLDLGYVLTDEWAFDFTPTLRVRWYDDYFDQDRRDIRAGLTLKAVWTPDWLTEQQPDAKIEFQIKLQRNVSTTPDQSYSLWDIGPAVVFSRRF